MWLLYLFLFFLGSTREGLSAKDRESVCKHCEKTPYDIPFYCTIKHDMPQCLVSPCPRVCEVSGKDTSSSLVRMSNTGYKKYVLENMASLPPYFPKAPEEYHVHHKFFEDEDLEEELPSGQEMGRSMDTTLEESPKHYDEKLCVATEGDTLQQLGENSKYILYRPTNGKKTVAEIKEYAAMYGLVLAEIRTTQDYFFLSKSGLAKVLSSFGEGQPRQYYAYDFKDVPLEDTAESSTTGKSKQNYGNFTYDSDGSKLTFAVMDPRPFARMDENCGLMTYALHGDKKPHLATVLRDCQNPVQKNEVLYGLLMYPVGSFCYRRSDEECMGLNIEKKGGESTYHNFIEIGQTRKRFIYMHTDQRTWKDAKDMCTTKGLQFFDLDPFWDDAIRVQNIIDNFLRQTPFNPVTIFWTSGKFKKSFADKSFRWESTLRTMKTGYKREDPPYVFDWWGNKKGLNASILLKSRRKEMPSPCVALAINPEDKADRAKINFKAWYCDFPSFFLCYKEINQTDYIMDEKKLLPNRTTGVKLYPSADACSKRNETDGTDQEEVHPYDQNCRSASKNVMRISPHSKFVKYEPSSKTLTVEDVKKKCFDYNLVPAEIRTVVDWLSILNGGIGNQYRSDSTNHIYAIGTEDLEELGKLTYNHSKKLITFSMIYGEGNTEKTHRCIVLDRVPTSDGSARELMMKHVSCQKGSSENNVVRGLCMFKPTSHCFKESSEEIEDDNNFLKNSTIIPLGLARQRSIFFNPFQRTWEQAKTFCEKAKLSFLEFDAKTWGDDFADVMKLWKEKVADKTELNRMAPLWTSGRLQGGYKADGASGTWESTKAPLNMQPTSNQKWLKYKWNNLTDVREGNVEKACVEASFDDHNKVVKLRPDYCDIPKFFLCYRKSRKRNDPPPSNSLGINIIETGDLGKKKNDRTMVRAPPDLGKFPAGHNRASQDFAQPDGQKESDESVSESAE